MCEESDAMLRSCVKDSESKETKTEIQQKKKSYNCEECKEECFGLAAYCKHIAQVHGKSFKCETCNKEY